METFIFRLISQMIHFFCVCMNFFGGLSLEVKLFFSNRKTNYLAFLLFNK